ncbi:hypothetical protein, partial [Bacillus thuringiensis]|uniref:hypothetical protein n=1 Tax=Bacillus thuringiensis TaxID=1428 RepID=UPI001C92EA60
ISISLKYPIPSSISPTELSFPTPSKTSSQTNSTPELINLTPTSFISPTLFLFSTISSTPLLKS